MGMLGGATGSLSRYLVGTAIMNRMGGRFPRGTVLINVTGSFLIGFNHDTANVAFEPPSELAVPPGGRVPRRLCDVFELRVGNSGAGAGGRLVARAYQRGRQRGAGVYFSFVGCGPRR